MRKLATTFTVLAILLLIATAPAPATLGGLCCACTQGDTFNASPSGPPMLIPTNALYCVDIPTADLANQTMRCENLWGTLECEAFHDPVPCADLLAEAGFICPAAGAPAAGPWMLTGIVVALALAGMLAASRRVA